MTDDDFAQPIPLDRFITRKVRNKRSRGMPELGDFSWFDALAYDAEYSPNEFYTGSRDDDGKSSSMTVWMPDAVAAIFSKILHGQFVPDYDSNQDIIRDAIVHRFYYLATRYEMPDEIVEWLRTQILVSEAKRTKLMREDDRQMVESIERELDACDKDRDSVRFQRLLDKAKERIETLHDPWREELQAVIDRAERRMR